MESSAFDGYFSVIEKNDGFYAEIYAPGMNGKAVQIKDIQEYLEAKKIGNVDFTELEQVLPGIEDKLLVKVADKKDIGTSHGDAKPFRVDVSDDNMYAYLLFFPTEEVIPIEMEKIETELRIHKVSFGINENAIREALEERQAGKSYIVAKGLDPKDPISGTVEYLFKTTRDYTPEVDEQGNVNYRKLSVISHVQQGQKLAILHQTIPGEPGENVLGKPIPAIKGKPVRIKYGKNTVINEDKTELFAVKSGLVKLMEDKIIVHDVYEVPNNVGNSTGDIDFDGSVIVHGNVISGFSVKATGDVEVMGVVESSTVIAGGAITIHSGIQGMGKSHVEAGGDVQTKFIEQANVSCVGNVHSEAILHSSVSCKGEVKVEGKKGMISGGRVRAGAQVFSRTLGSHMGTTTEVEVGIDPVLLEEYNDLRKTLPKMKEEADKLEKVILLLNKRKEMMGNLEEDKTEMYQSAIRNKVFLANKISKSEKRCEELKSDVENRNSGLVKVSGVVYPGVRIGIGNVNYYVRDELQYVTFYKDGADVKLRPL